MNYGIIIPRNTTQLLGDGAVLQVITWNDFQEESKVQRALLYSMHAMVCVLPAKDITLEFFQIIF